MSRVRRMEMWLVYDELCFQKAVMSLSNQTSYLN